jgi:hypothetical protein
MPFGQEPLFVQLLWRWERAETRAVSRARFLAFGSWTPLI